MPPGPFPYPFLGNIPQIMTADPVRPFSKLAETYGDMYTLTFPQGMTVILNTATLVREARLAPGKQEDLMGKTPDSIYPFTEIMGDNLTTCDYSPAHTFKRKVFVSAMHTFGAGLEQAAVRAGHAVNLAMNEIEKKPDRSFSPKSILESCFVVQLWEWLTSEQISLNDPVVQDMNELGEILSRCAVLVTVYQLLPFLRYLPTSANRDIKRAEEIREKVFPPSYRAIQNSYTAGTARHLTDSFISAYQKELAKEFRKDIGTKDTAIPGLMMNVVVVGSETTSTWLTWFFLYMVLYPKVQSKIHEELDEVVGRDRVPNRQDAENLPYLQAALCEVGRICRMVEVVGTNAIRDTSIAGYHIPKGTFVGLNIQKAHENERDWPEPRKFKPERFLDEDGKFVGWTKKNAFLPFGIGRRECPGQPLARVSMYSFASALLHRYEFGLPEGAEMPSIKVSIAQVVARPDDYLVIAKQRELNVEF